MPDGFFFLLGVACALGPVVVYRTLVRPSDRTRTVPFFWRLLPMLVLGAGMLAGLSFSMEGLWKKHLVVITVQLFSLAVLNIGRMERKHDPPRPLKHTLGLSSPD